MLVLGNFVHRYLSPFVVGASMAGITVVESGPAAVLLLVVAGGFAYMGLPPGGRMLRRLAQEEP